MPVGLVRVSADLSETDLGTGVVDAVTYGPGVLDALPHIQGLLADFDSVYVPPGTYRLSAALIISSGKHLYGAGDLSVLSNIRTGTPGISQGSTLLMGTYGPANDDSCFAEETSYNVSDLAVGDRTVTFATGAQAANFAAGDLVSLESGTDSGAGFGTPNFLTEVLSVDAGAGTLTMKHRCPYALAVNGGTAARIRRLNTGTVTGLDGQPAFVCMNATVSDLVVQNANTSYPAINLSLYGCHFDNVTARGGMAFNGNPCARTTVDHSVFEHRYQGIEVAYLSHDLTVRDTSITRIGNYDASASCAVWGNVTEGAGRIYLDRVTISEFGTSGSADLDAVTLPRESSIRGSTIHGTRPGANAVYLGAGSVAEGNRIAGHAEHGIVCGGQGSKAIRNDIGATNSTFYAVQVENGAHDALVDANACNITGTQTSADAIKVGTTSDTQGPTCRRVTVRDNKTYYTTGGFVKATRGDHTGTLTETVVNSIALPGGRDGAMYRVKHMMRAIGSAGTKTVRITLNSTVLASFVVLAVSGNSFLDVDGFISFDSSANNNISYHFTVSNAGVVTVVEGTVSLAFASASPVFISYQLGNTGDTMSNRLTIFERQAGQLGSGNVA